LAFVRWITAMSGPLSGVRVIELAGIGPGPFGAMMLSDLGAEVVRIDRPGAPPPWGGHDYRHDVLARGRRSLAVDLKRPATRELVLELLERADVLIDPFRPGVCERLGIGPDACLARNPRLVFARMTGWGQDGPLAATAGHDIDYIALAGPLAAIGRPGEPPPPPLNLVGDFGGGGMLLVVGVLAALHERERSGEGQVVDVAMLDGAATLFSAVVGFMNMGIWSERRGENMLDGAAPYYDTYATADGRFVAVGALEPKFYDLLLSRLGLDPDAWPQEDRSLWPELKERLREIFADATLEEWRAHFAGTDACVAPVLSLSEAIEHPHVAQRRVYELVDEHPQPAPAPRFSRTPGSVAGPSPYPGEHTTDVLTHWGITEERVRALLASGAVVQASPPLSGPHAEAVALTGGRPSPTTGGQV
jgi:alpha-methylacyl-CoA racemase